MNCKEVENILIFYVEGELNNQQAQSVENHLQRCDSCQKIYKKLKADINFLNNDRISEVNESFYENLIVRIESENNKTGRIKQLAVQFLAYAAAVFIAVFIGVALGRGINRANENFADETTNVSEFQLFAESYGMSLPDEDAYEIIITENK